MKYENIIAKRSDKTVYRDGNLKIKVYDEATSKVNVLRSRTIINMTSAVTSDHAPVYTDISFIK